MTTQVTMHVWRVAARDVPRALVAGRRTAARLRRSPTVSFAKVLGTASDRFVPTAATPRRWAAITCWREHPDDRLTDWWRHHAEETATLSLRALRSVGVWDGQAPFPVADPDSNDPGANDPGWDGAVVALTRSTVRLSKAVRFYRAVPAVAAELRRADGCRVAFGIGEAPLLRQGTVSVWDSAAAMRAFAGGAAAHVRAVAATPATGWYAEQLFARFALVDASGTIDGASVG